MRSHKVTKRDQERIRCDTCDAPAIVCYHSHWKVGTKAGVSFWYKCAAHSEVSTQCT